MMLMATAGCSLLHRHERHAQRPRELHSYYPDVRCRAEKRVTRYVGRIATDHVARYAKFYARAETVVRLSPAEAAALTRRPGRLVLEVDAQGRVTRAFCG